VRTRPYRPRTNGKAERFIRTLLGGWAYGAIYRDSDERRRALAAPLMAMLELLESGEDLLEPRLAKDVRVRRQRAIAENASGHTRSVGPTSIRLDG
jgi:hypothetical protein